MDWGEGLLLWKGLLPPTQVLPHSQCPFHLRYHMLFSRQHPKAALSEGPHGLRGLGERSKPRAFSVENVPGNTGSDCCHSASPEQKWELRASF